MGGNGKEGEWVRGWMADGRGGCSGHAISSTGGAATNPPLHCQSLTLWQLGKEVDGSLPAHHAAAAQRAQRGQRINQGLTVACQALHLLLHPRPPLLHGTQSHILAAMWDRGSRGKEAGR